MVDATAPSLWVTEKTSSRQGLVRVLTANSLSDAVIYKDIRDHVA